MSLEAMVWALKKAPVTDAGQKVVLIGLADHADDEGRDAYPSQSTLAKYAKCSLRTVSTRLKALEKQGVLVRGDQQKVAHIRADRRPVVYDLNYDVQDLHAVEDDMQTASGRGGHGMKSGVERHEAQRSHDMKAVADKPYLNHPEPSGGVLTDTKMSETTAPDETPPSSRPEGFRHGKWMPSDNALQTAREVNKLVDIPILISKYAVWCQEKKKQPTSGEWLRWFFRDEKDLQAEERRIQHQERTQPNWINTAE